MIRLSQGFPKDKIGYISRPIVNDYMNTVRPLILVQIEGCVGSEASVIIGELSNVDWLNLTR